MSFLENKVVLITGGSSGIGKAMVIESLKGGAYVATCGRSPEKLSAAFPDTDPAKLLLVTTDVRSESECAAFVRRALERFGRIDVLINNAGITMRALFADLRLDVLHEVMDINFWGTVNCTRYALPALIDSRGVIVGVSSIAGYRGLPARSGYSASKFAMQGFLESLRTELLHSGTHVMWVSPGFTASNIRNLARSADGSVQGETPLDEAGLMSAEECARRILRGVEQRKRTIVMTVQGKLTVLINRLFPALADRLVYNHFRKEPGSPLKQAGVTN